MLSLERFVLSPKSIVFDKNLDDIVLRRKVGAVGSHGGSFFRLPCFEAAKWGVALKIFKSFSSKATKYTNP